MSRTWLHLSEPRLQADASFADDVAREALIGLVSDRRTREGVGPDFIVVSGDLATTGANEDYERLDTFLHALLKAAGLQERRDRLIVVPGEHDVCRDSLAGLASTLASRREADDYFAPGHQRPHFALQAHYRRWYDRFFGGLRTTADWPCDEIVELDLDGVRVALLPINTAVFALHPRCQGKLWIGLRALRPATRRLAALDVDLRIAVMHHPLGWLAAEECSLATELISGAADLILHGHHGEPEAETIRSAETSVIRVAASTCANSSDQRQCILYGTLDNGAVSLRPYTYVEGRGRWVVDTAVFPNGREHGGVFTLDRNTCPRTAMGVLPAHPRQSLFPGRRERAYPASQQRRLLTAYAQRRGDRVTWDYLVNDGERVVDSTVVKGFDAVAAEARAWLKEPTAQGTAAIRHRLSELVLGDRGRAGFQKLLRRLFRRSERASDLLLGPCCAPVRCRIITDDPALRTMPYCLAAVDGHYLADDGWTFELSTSDQGCGEQENIHLSGPCTVLIIAPHASALGYNSARHLRDLDALLGLAWPLEAERGRLEQHRILARSRSEIEAVLKIHTPQVVYIFGQVDAIESPPQLRVDRGSGSEYVDLPKFLSRLSGARVVYMNVRGSGLGNLVEAELLGPACVLLPIAEHAPADAESAGLAWVEALLRRGFSPVGALDVVQRQRSSAHACSMIAYTRYKTWRATVAPTEDFVAKVAAHLDRTAQRTLLLERVRDLVQGSRRVLSVLAPAPRDQNPGGLGDLLRRYVHDQTPDVRICYESQRLPQASGDLAASIGRRFAEGVLGSEPGDSMVEGLLRYRDKRATRLGLAASTSIILWIEWRASSRDLAASSDMIDALLLFGAEVIAPQCPENLQIVSLLTIVASHAGCERVARYCREDLRAALGSRVTSAIAGYVLLPQLGDVGHHDIEDYLYSHSSCPDDLVSSAGQGIFSRTCGNYEETVSLIEENELTGTWSESAALAPKPQRAARKPRIFR